MAGPEESGWSETLRLVLDLLSARLFLKISLKDNFDKQ